MNLIVTVRKPGGDQIEVIFQSPDLLEEKLDPILFDLTP